MHEYALTRRMVEIILEAAQAHGGARVLSAKVVVGGNRGIVPDTLALYFDIIAQGTPAQGAALDVRVIPAEMYCPQCARPFPRPHFSFACPRCNTLGRPTETGNEFYVESVELET